VVQVAIAVGSSVGAGIVNIAGGRADFTLGCALALLGFVALQRLVARERPRTKAPDCRCSPSLDWLGTATFGQLQPFDRMRKWP
jgi:hypothetical protein